MTKICMYVKRDAFEGKRFKSELFFGSQKRKLIEKANNSAYSGKCSSIIGFK